MYYAVLACLGALALLVQTWGMAINRKVTKLMANLDNLISEVQQMETVIDSAITLINGMAQEIRNAGTDQNKLNALADRLDSKANALAAAIAANTAADAEEPAEPTEPEPAPETEEPQA